MFIHLGGFHLVYTYAFFILLHHVSCLQGLGELNGKVLEGFAESGFCNQGTEWRLGHKKDDFLLALEWSLVSL